MLLTPLWFLTYILSVGKIAGQLNDWSWTGVLTPALISILIEMFLIEDDET